MIDNRVESNSSAVAIRATGITKRYGDTVAVDGVTLEVKQGETVCIIGPSGSGKSTFLRCCNLLEIPDEGSLEIHGDEYLRMPGRMPGVRRLRELRSRTAMVFQSFDLFAHLTAKENIAIALQHVHRKSRAESLRIATELLGVVGLQSHEDKKPASLSGGQQQRVGIARALAVEPDVLLFDEPTSALDPELVGEVLSLMNRLSKQGSTMIVVTHEMEFARQVADRVVVMDKGQIVDSGTAEYVFELSENERTRRFVNAVLTRGLD